MNLSAARIQEAENGDLTSPSQSVRPVTPLPDEPRVLISLHGIRTRGAWQKELSGSLGRAFIHEPLDFGFFGVLRLLLPSQRRSRVEWFRDRYTQICIEHQVTRPSLIAHSMGSYLFASAVELFPEMIFDRVILCGSIIRPDFPWSSYGESRVTRILNDSGLADRWSRIVGRFVEDSGPSGVHGFSDTAGGRVVQLTNPGFRHSDYFYKLRYKNTWLPFLNGTDPVAAPPLPSPQFNFEFWKTIVVAGAVVLLALWLSRHVLKDEFGRLWRAKQEPSIVHSDTRIGVDKSDKPSAAAPPSPEIPSKNAQTLTTLKPPPATTRDEKPPNNLPHPLGHGEVQTHPDNPLPFPSDQFAIKLHKAKSAGGAVWAAFCHDYEGCTIERLPCAYQNELTLDAMDREQGLSGIKAIFGSGDFTVLATCYLAAGKQSSRYHETDKGTSIRLIKGTLDQIRPDGSIRLIDCVFDP